MTPDELRAALDNEVLSDGQNTWTVEVYSVSDHDDRRWVQLSLHGEPTWTLTLRLSPQDSIEHVRYALTQWLEHPGEPTEEVINIA